MDEYEGPSKGSGACVLVVLGAVVTGLVFAVSEPVGVLSFWAVMVVLLWRSARKMSGMPATPPPEEGPPLTDVYARETGEVAKVVPIASGAGCILHPVRENTPEE